MTDTRLAGPRLAANTDLPLIPGQVLSVTVFASLANGTAVIHTCGAPVVPNSDAEFVFATNESVVRQITTDQAGSICLQSTTAVHVKVIDLGDVASVPVIGGLQYHELASPIEVLDELVDELPAAGVDLPLVRPAGVPASAVSIVYAIETDNSGTTYGNVRPCGGPEPFESAFITVDTYNSSIVFRNVPGSVNNCLFVAGSGFGSVFVSVLGWLDAAGSDLTSIPPELRSTRSSLAPPGFEPITPLRVLDTRSGIGAPKGPLLLNDVIQLDLGPYVTDLSTSVVMNVTVTQPQAGGYLTVAPCDEPTPDASNLNFVVRQDVPNLVSVPLGFSGLVCFTSSASTHVIADLAGTFELDGGSLGTAVTPERILDTRNGIGSSATKLAAGTTRTLQIAGRAGVPASGVTAVTMNVTATGVDGDGYLTVFPCDQPKPDASNLNYVRGRDIPNLVTVKLSASGTVCLFATGTTHVIADVAMWFGAAGTDGFYDITPTRILDTRRPSPVGFTSPASKVAAGQRRAREVVAITGTSLADVHAVTMNVTVTGPAAGGYLTLYPCNATLPDASNLNFAVNQDIPNLVTVKVSSSNEVCFTPSADTHVIADVAGYFSSANVVLWEDILVD
jgi:hypothetical protein